MHAFLLTQHPEIRVLSRHATGLGTCLASRRWHHRFSSRQRRPDSQHERQHSRQSGADVACETTLSEKHGWKLAANIPIPANSPMIEVFPAPHRSATNLSITTPVSGTIFPTAVSLPASIQGQVHRIAHTFVTGAMPISPSPTDFHRGRQSITCQRHLKCLAQTVRAISKGRTMFIGISPARSLPMRAEFANEFSGQINAALTGSYCAR